MTTSKKPPEVQVAFLVLNGEGYLRRNGLLPPGLR
jgi:hypothetical protein